jgi:uncharacterized protein YceK
MRIVSVFALLLLSGCSTITNYFSPDSNYSGISPPPLHTYDTKHPAKDIPISTVAEKIKIAEVTPYSQYYAAMDIAKLPTATTSDIQIFLKTGVTVVNVSCLRWFKSLSEAEIRFNFSQSGQNVIQDLGTTLLGLGKANPLIVGAYGAGFTAVNGFEKAFSQSFFLAPNANKVESHIFSSLDQQAIEILGSADPTKPNKYAASFSDAYLALERYGDICTQQTAKEIINSSLDQTKTTISADQGGKVITTVTDSAAQSLAAFTQINADKKAAIATEAAKSADAIKALNAAIVKAATDNFDLKNQIANLQQINATFSKQSDLENTIKILQDQNSELSKKINK